MSLKQARYLKIRDCALDLILFNVNKRKKGERGGRIIISQETLTRILQILRLRIFIEVRI